MVRSWDVAQDLPPFDVRGVFRDERGELVAFLRSLNAESWRAPTVNAGWNVHDVALHLLGNDIGRLGSAPISNLHEGRVGDLPFDALARAIEKSNERWVAGARRIAPPLLLDFLAFVGPRVDAAFASVDTTGPGVAVAWTGSGPSPYWLDIAREYTERWVHGAQIRLAVGVPPLLERRWLNPVLEAFMRCLPRAYEDVEAEMGSVVAVEVTGEAGGTWSVRRQPARWHLVPDASDSPVARVRIDADTAWRLLSRSIPPAAAMPAIATEGDLVLAQAATHAVAIMTTKL